MVLAVEQASCGGAPQPASPDAAGEMLTRWAPGRIVWQSPSRRGPGFWSDLPLTQTKTLESNRLNEKVFQALYNAFAQALPQDRAFMRRQIVVSTMARAPVDFQYAIRYQVQYGEQWWDYDIQTGHELETAQRQGIQEHEFACPYSKQNKSAEAAPRDYIMRFAESAVQNKITGCTRLVRRIVILAPPQVVGEAYFVEGPTQIEQEPHVADDASGQAAEKRRRTEDDS